MSQCRLFLTARKPEANHIASILDPFLEDEGVPAALFESETAPGEWCYSVYVADDEKTEWEKRIRDRLGSDGFGLELRQELIEDNIDWIDATLRELVPVRAGRFVVHGTHDRLVAATASVPIEINAGQAFGTGHHGTTAGCLELLEHTLRKRVPKTTYDIGTGSGVLAIALAKAARVNVLATDIDPVATTTGKENAAANGVRNHVRFETSVGFNHPVFRAVKPADLVFANILAGPLRALASPIAGHCAPGADVILSGLLPHQEARIVATYRQHGMIFRRRLIRDGWLSLLLTAK